MKLEVGKYYKTRDGRKVGPMIYNPDPFGENWAFFEDGNKGRSFDDDTWSANGEYGNTCHETHDLDLVSEWPSDSPVRTVTRKEIVPGVYGDVKVHDPGTKYVRINVDAAMSSDQLRAAAATLIEIADALEGNSQ